MDSHAEYLEDIARAFAGMNDAERLDHAADVARSLRFMVDAIRTQDVDAPPAMVARLAGAMVAFEAITAGRTTGGDTDRTDGTEGDR